MKIGRVRVNEISAEALALLTILEEGVEGDVPYALALSNFFDRVPLDSEIPWYRECCEGFERC